MASCRLLKPAAAGDALGLEGRQRSVECVDPGEMRAVGAGPRHELGMSVEHQRRALVLHGGCQPLYAVDQGAVIGRGQAQQHGRDVGGGERAGKRVRSPSGSMACGVTR